jgi:hypothetical protein
MPDLRWIKPARGRRCANRAMNMPSFFDDVPRLRVRDPLAHMLGSAQDGVFEYGYGDVVRLTGHSCPTVAGAYWLTWLALRALYPHTLPERGGVRVEFRENARIGSTGVTATVVQMLTGAAGSSGFKGIGGRFSRAGLQRFAPEIPLSLRFTRLDNGGAVDAAVDLDMAPPDPALGPLLQRCARHGADDAEAAAELGRLWQQRVAHLLLDLAHDPGVFVIRKVERARVTPLLRADRYIVRPRRPDNAA